jgi:hypothetical protein
MHCNDEELLRDEHLSENVHFKNCIECQKRMWLFKKLRNDAEQMPVFKPSELAWDKIRKTLPKQEDKKPWFNLPMAIAASFIVGVAATFTGFKLWHNHQVNQFVMNSDDLETELHRVISQHYISDNDLWEISQIDMAINNAKNQQEEILLWQKRNEILTRIVNQATESYEAI